MRYRYQQVWLNDVAITDVHPLVLLQHISEEEPKLTQKTYTRPGGGQLLTANIRERREITIEFAIREGLDFARRQDVYQAVSAWAAAGGWLQLSSHPGQRIYVEPVSLPALGRLRDWTENMAITFAAIWWPYWQDVIPQEITVTPTANTAGSTTLAITGTAPTMLEVHVASPSATLSSIVLGTPGCSMTLSLGTDAVTTGQTLDIDYDERHLLRIHKGSTQLLKRRTGDDDLVLMPGSRTITYTCDAGCSLTLKARGMWA